MINNSVLKDLLKEYDKKQVAAAYDLENRKKELYAKIPRLKEIEIELNKHGIEAAKCILSVNNDSCLVDFHKELDNLKKERLELLKKDGKDLNYLSPIYECSKCNLQSLG